MARARCLSTQEAERQEDRECEVSPSYILFMLYIHKT
jgi:hypothetical protein